MQVGHPAGEELRVGAADAGLLDVDDDLPRGGRRRLDVADRPLPWSRDEERARG
jgi:hypothetical protein